MPKLIAEKPVFLRPRSKFWQIRYTLPNGSERRLSSKTTDYNEACALYQSLVGGADELSITALAGRFFTDHQIKPKTVAGYQTSFRAWQPLVGHLRASDFTKDHAKAFVASRLGTVKHVSIRADLAFMSSFLRFACMIPGGPDKNVMDDFDKRHLKLSPSRIRSLASDEEKSLLSEVREAHQRLITLFAIDAGLRRSEILNLKVRQADPRRRVVVLGSNTKTGKGRVIPMTHRLNREVIRWWRTNPTLRAGDWLISNPETHKPYTEIRWFSLACGRAGIESFTFHDLRHHFASRFVEAGGRLQPLAKLLGHTTIAMSERYAHLSSDTAAAEFRRVMRRA